MKSRFIYSEARLSELLGISRTDIIKLRKEMQKGKYWRKSRKGKGGAIELSSEAVEIVLKTFGLTDTDLSRCRLDFAQKAESTIDPKQTTLAEAHRLQTEPPQSPPAIDAPEKTLKVTAICVNARIVKARNGTGEEYQVIVPNNRVWSVGDDLRAKQSKHIGYYELASKGPRWKSDRMYRFAEGFA